MALAQAILALLIDHPASGYDITKQFESSVGNFWRATHQQIYRELAKLEEQDWLKAEVIPQIGRPDKKLYQVTELGKAQLTAWIAEPCDPMAIKEEILIKVFLGYLVPPETLIKELKRHRELHEKKLASYQKIEQQFFRNLAELSLANKFSYMTLRRGVRYETDWIAWCDEVLELLS